MATTERDTMDNIDPRGNVIPGQSSGNGFSTYPSGRGGTANGDGFDYLHHGPRVDGGISNEGRTGSVNSVDGSDANNVPVPLRVTKKRRQRPDGDVSVGSSATNHSIGEADLGFPRMTSSQRVSGDAGQQYYANLSFVGDENGRGGGGGGPRSPGGGGGGQRRRGRPPPAVDPIRNPVVRNVSIQQLRVHIKAQPGTSVHITPTVTPVPTPPRGATQLQATRRSVEIGHPSAARYAQQPSVADGSETEI